MKVKSRISDLLKQLNNGIFEKEEVIAKTLLSSVAGESIFLLGAPGVAKSLVARQLKYAFKNGTNFEYLMNRFSTPDEIFGPISISKLKDQDKYERIVTNYLPSANVVFLDEIWKAGPSIQNALLTVLNEKIYRNGDIEIHVPIKALISASNELPSKNEGLEALWDRFLIRLNVEGISDKENFNTMISSIAISKNATITNSITDEEYTLWSNEINTIEIPQNVFEIIHIVRNYIQLHNQNKDNIENQLYVSDRRWRKIIRLLRTSAFLNERTSVDLMDCFLIKDCIWNEIEQKSTVDYFINNAIQKYGYSVSLDFTELKETLKEFRIEIEEETKYEKDTRVETLVNARGDYYEIIGYDSQNNLIKQSDYKDLTNSNKSYSLYYWSNSYDQRVTQQSYYKNFEIRKGNSKFSIFIDDKEYILKTSTKGDLKQLSKKPHKAVEKDWDTRILEFLNITNESKININSYKENELKHIRTNLFVNPELATIVEKHISDTLKEVEKLEVEIKKIQNDYKKLKDDIL